MKTSDLPNAANFPLAFGPVRALRRLQAASAQGPASVVTVAEQGSA